MEKEKIECVVSLGTVCPRCGHTMYTNVDSVCCVNTDCRIYNKQFKPPTIILKEM